MVVIFLSCKAEPDINMGYTSTMATKRKIEDTESKGDVHTSRQSQVYGINPRAAKKPKRFEPPMFRKQAHVSSVNAIKKRIRDVTRRLERIDNVSADVRAEDERALLAYQQELATAEAEKTRQKMIKKYHMVRFFERQKATRHLKKLRKRLLSAETTEDVEDLKREMHETEVDLNYTQYHPLSQTYISLYPPFDSTRENQKSETTQKSKPPIWLEVERCMKEGTLEALRNRRIGTPSRPLKQLQHRPAKSIPPTVSIDTSGLNRRQRRAQRGTTSAGVRNKSMASHKNGAPAASDGIQDNHTGNDQDIDSDGGFFE